MDLAGGVRVAHGQFYVLDEDFEQPLLAESFHGQHNGLCGARTGRSLFLVTGLRTGTVPVRVEFHDAEPTLEDEWEDAVDASFELTGAALVVLGWAGESDHTVPVPAPGRYRVRYCASGMDSGREQHTSADRPAPDRYRLQFWPGPMGRDAIVRLTSELARSWHTAVRTMRAPASQMLPPPIPMPSPPVSGLALTPDELDRLTASWRRVWGHRIPSEGRVGVRHGDGGTAVRLLPVERNYPATDEDWSQLRGGYREVFALLAAHSAGTLLITHGWQQHGAGYRPGRDDYLATFTPTATHWRTDDLALEPGYQSLIHSFVQRLPTLRTAMPVIELHAMDGTDDVLIVDDELRWTVVLRNGGLDVLTDDRALLDRLDRYRRPMAGNGTVRTWSDEEGWGVIDSPETPGGCWAHCSAVAVAGHRSLTPGQRVHLEWSPVRDQDGYRFVAERVWLVGADPIDISSQSAGGAYRSTLTITFDRDAGRPGNERG